MGVVSQNYFTSRSSGVRKLNKKKVKWIIKQLQKGTKVSEIADAMNITIRRVYQIKQFYEEKGRIPELKRPGRKPKEIDSKIKEIIYTVYDKYKLSPVILEKIIERNYDIHIPHNTIYKVMLEYGLVVENKKKKRQRKWVRFERKHSMSLWQGDWKQYDGKWIIAFMDDASRLITCYGVFESPTTENTLKVLERGFTEYGVPDEILTDHGTQFVSSRNSENAKHKFKEFLKENRVKHIVARINHPQTNGKIERWFGLLEQKMHFFNSIEEFVKWYNFIKPHTSLDFDTPHEAFYQKLPPERVFGLGRRWLFEL